MELHAVKVQTGRYMSTWELRIQESGKVVGELIHNPSKGTYTALVRSRCTGLVRESDSGEDRDQVLAWARRMIVDEPTPTLESLDAEIARCREFRYQDEMSDDFAYSNGKIARWDRLLNNLQQLRAQVVDAVRDPQYYLTVDDDIKDIADAWLLDYYDGGAA